MANVANREEGPARLDWKSWDEFPPPKLPVGIPVAMLAVLAFGGLMAYRSIMAVAGRVQEGETIDAGTLFLPALGMILASLTVLLAYGLWKMRNWARLSSIALLMFGIFLYTIQFLVEQFTVGLLLMLIPLAVIVYLLLPGVVQEYDKAEVT